MIKPRYYQQEATNAVIAHVKKKLSPCLIELATGAGKSIVVTMLAKFFAQVAPTKKVICIAPSKELVEQNAEKFKLAGGQASIFCASAGSKCFKSQVIFASPQSLLKSADKIAQCGVSAIIIDEAHGITNTLKSIVSLIQNFEIKGIKINDKLRVVGMSATPYRLGTGFIYSIDGSSPDEILYDEKKAVDPFFTRLVYKLTTSELIDQKFLTPVIVGLTSEEYDTSNLEMKMGKFTRDSLSLAVEGKHSKTSKIISEVLSVAEESKGVIIFATTIAHAQEIASLLPKNQTRIITGALGKKERNEHISSFKNGWIKYIVNVDVLTTGFDAPHIDCVVVMRPTESAGLLQQMIGRGLRLSDGKKECLLLDYAENIKRHGLEDDLFSPCIKTKIKSESSAQITVTCPNCGIVSDKKRRSEKEFKGLVADSQGYFLVSGTQQATRFENGEPVEWEGVRLTTLIDDPSKMNDFGECEKKEVPVPAHYSRRCSNPEWIIMSGKPVPCPHRYSFKICPKCNSENDIAARHCTECRERLVDYNKKLTIESSVSNDTKAEWVDVIDTKYTIHESLHGSLSLKTEFKTSEGNVTQYITKKQHWHFRKICRASLVDPDLVGDDYDQCRLLSKSPTQIKIKKSSGKIELKEIGDEFKESEFAKNRHIRGYKF